MSSDPFEMALAISIIHLKVKLKNEECYPSFINSILTKMEKAVEKQTLKECFETKQCPDAVQIHRISKTIASENGRKMMLENKLAIYLKLVQEWALEACTDFSTRRMELLLTLFKRLLQITPAKQLHTVLENSMLVLTRVVFVAKFGNVSAAKTLRALQNINQDATIKEELINHMESRYSPGSLKFNDRICELDDTELNLLLHFTVNSIKLLEHNVHLSEEFEYIRKTLLIMTLFHGDRVLITMALSMASASDSSKQLHLSGRHKRLRSRK